jgi:hypothetical protein
MLPPVTAQLGGSVSTGDAVKHSAYEVNGCGGRVGECAAEPVGAAWFVRRSHDSNVAVDGSFEEAAVEMHEVGGAGSGIGRPYAGSRF